MAKKKTYYDYLRQELGELVDQLQLPELYKQSLRQRWLDQVVWADKKAAECRQWHYRLRLTTIIGGVILPALVGINFQLGEENRFFRTWFPYVPFALSQVIAISAAVEEFCRFGDRWRDYRQMSEDLKGEGWQYLQSSGAYEKNKTHIKGYPMFASRVESIIKQDVQNYISDLVQQQAKQEAEIEKYLESAKEVTNDKSLFARPTPPPQPGYPNGGTPVAGMQPGMQPGYPNGAPMPGMQMGMQPGMQMGMQPGMQMGHPNGAPMAPGTATMVAPANAAGTATMVAPTTPGMNAPAATAPAMPPAGQMGLLRTKQTTIFKLGTQPAAMLPDNYKLTVNAGLAVGLDAYQDGGSNHLYVTFNQGVGPENRNVWYVYAPHVELLDRNGQAIATTPATPAPTAASTQSIVAADGSVELPVPYLSQTDNVQNPFGSCNVTSVAMCLKYLGVEQTNPSKQFEDELQDWLEERGLSRHEPGAMAQAVEGYGCQDRFSTTASQDEVKQWLAQGNPCIIHGYFTSYGHIVAVAGYNNQGFIIHDPYGEWHEGGYDRNDSSQPEKGKSVVYTYDMIRRTCMTDNQFWVHFVSREGFNPVGQVAAQPAAQPTAQPATAAAAGQPARTYITAEQLIQIAGSNAPSDRLRELTPGLNQTLERFQINTPLRIVHFLAQVAHESDCFNAMEEYASGSAYEGRDDLGNTQPGDGVRFKGRGLIQLTGRANYKQFSDDIGIDFVAQPEQVAQAPYAILVAGWYWNSRQLNEIADQDNLDDVTLYVNGGYNGLEDRRHYMQAAKRVLGC